MFFLALLRKVLLRVIFLCLLYPGAKYIVLRNGELHIRTAARGDSFRKYRCLVKNLLTGNVTPSVSAGQLIVTGIHLSFTHGQLISRVWRLISLKRIRKGFVFLGVVYLVYCCLFGDCGFYFLNWEIFFQIFIK